MVSILFATESMSRWLSCPVLYRQVATTPLNLWGETCKRCACLILSYEALGWPYLDSNQVLHTRTDGVFEVRPGTVARPRHKYKTVVNNSWAHEHWAVSREVGVAP